MSRLPSMGNLHKKTIPFSRLIPHSFRLSRIELIYIGILVVAGSVLVFLIPLGAGFDEHQHLVRVWQVSGGEMFPLEMSARTANFPEVFYDLSYRGKPLVEPVGFDYWKINSSLKLYDRGYHYGPIRTRATYFPALFIPQAIAMRFLGRIADLPVLVVYYATRFAGLLTYLVLTWLAIRWIPYGKWILFTLALAPTAIYQASTISADQISNGIGFLFIAGCLAIQKKSKILLKDFAVLVLLITLLFFAKINLVPLFILPFLIIPLSKYKNRTLYILLIALTLVLFAVIVIGWNQQVMTNLSYISTEKVNPIEQVKYVISQPLTFVSILIHDIATQGPKYLKGWIGVFGYDYGSPPLIAYYTFVISIGIVLFARAETFVPSRVVRLVLIFLFVICYIATSFILYVTFTELRGTFVYGVQGRYFTPISPLLFLGFAGLFNFRRFPFKILFSLAFSLTIFTFIASVILTYQVICGPSYYYRGLCYQPVYKNFSPMEVSSPPITKDETLLQEIVPVCDGMTMIQVRINSPGYNANGGIQFSLLDVKQDKYLVDQVVKSNALPTDNWYSMYFNPDWESADKQYNLTIRGIDTELNAAPLVAFSIRPEYPSGELFVRGASVEDDVIFRYGCIAGLDKIFYKPPD